MLLRWQLRQDGSEEELHLVRISLCTSREDFTTGGESLRQRDLGDKQVCILVGRYEIRIEDSRHQRRHGKRTSRFVNDAKKIIYEKDQRLRVPLSIHKGFVTSRIAYRLI